MIKWTFAADNGGEQTGFHNPGVETFKGNIERYLAREAIQNSLDAKDLDAPTSSAVVVKFDLEKYEPDDIPDIEGLSDAFRRCAKFWDSNEKATEFFKRAEKLSKGKKILALRIADFNTTGVLGSDKDRKKNWYNLIRCSGSSSKGAGEGGSFGIGKNAPFANSNLRTVLYSTLNSDGESIFQGVARLVTHDQKEGTVQATGYLGIDNGASIRDKKEIPKKFLRTKQGTDLIILGYQADKETWSKDLIYSVLANFWPAIHWGTLEVHVGDTKITKKTLPDLLETYAAEPDFDAQLYFKAFTEPTTETNQELPTLNKCTVKLLSGETDMPKRVAMVRATGMVITYKHFRSIVPFCGVFICKNKVGNGILRQMEPPRHDEWDPDHPDKGEHKKTEAEFGGFIRDCIKDLAPAESEKVLNIPDLSQWLPDDDDASDDDFSGEGEESKKESFERAPEPQPIKGRKMDRSRKPADSDAGRPGQGDAETEEAGDDQGTGGGPGKNDGFGGDGDGGGGGGGEGSGESKPKKGKHDGTSSKPAIPVRFRVFPKDLASGVYSVLVQPLQKANKPAMLTVSAVGDDTKTAVGLTQASVVKGDQLEIPRPGYIGPVTFPAKGGLRLELVLREPRRLAMEVEAHEA